MTRPHHDHGHSKTPFIHLPLFSAKRSIAGSQFSCGPSIVTEENKNRFLSESFRFNGLEDLAHTRIQMREHGGKDSPMHVFNITVHCHVGFGSLQRTVNRVVRDLKVERFVGVTMDEIYRLSGKGIGQVGSLCDGLASTNDGIVGIVIRLIMTHVGGINQPLAGPSALATAGKHLSPKHGGHVSPGWRYKKMSFVGESKKFIKPMSHGMKLSSSPQVPLTDQSSGVSPVMQPFSKGNLLLGQSNPGFLIACSNRVELITESGRNTARQQASPGRAAVGSCNVSLGKANSLAGHGVNIRGPDLTVPLHTAFPVAEIIGQKDDEVGKGLFLGKGRRPFHV